MHQYLNMCKFHRQTDSQTKTYGFLKFCTVLFDCVWFYMAGERERERLCVRERDYIDILRLFQKISNFFLFTFFTFVYFGWSDKSMHNVLILDTKFFYPTFSTWYFLETIFFEPILVFQQRFLFCQNCPPPPKCCAGLPPQLFPSSRRYVWVSPLPVYIFCWLWSIGRWYLSNKYGKYENGFKVAMFDDKKTSLIANELFQTFLVHIW